MASKTAPKSQLRLEWVYGYRGHQCRNNLLYNGAKEIVFFVAGVGVVYNAKEHRQRFFLGHDDDIVSLAIHPEKLLVATGQVGKEPFICVWDSKTVQTVSILKDGHTHGVGSVAFSSDGQRLISSGLDQHSTFNVWDWRKGKVLATVRGHSDRVFDVQYNPYSQGQIVSCGIKHIKFWTLQGNTLSSKKGVFGKVGEIQTMLCLAFAPDHVSYSGTLSGDIYIWKNNNLARLIPNAHGGSIYSLHQSDEGYSSGGKDGLVRLWDSDFKPITKVDLTESDDGYKGLVVRSVCWRGDRVLAGTQDGEVFEISVSDRDKPQCLIQGHAEGELWALAVHPKKTVFATASDDCTVRLWSMQSNQLLSKTSVDNPVRSCAFNSEGSQLAIGMNDGSFMVLKTKDLSEIVHLKDRKQVIHEMKFSPDGQFLAVGSNDNYIDIYSVPQRYKKVGQCSGNSSFITHLDWSEDSKYLQSNSGAAERLFFKMPNGKQATNSDEIRNIHWATWTGVLGPEVNGIWEKYTDTNDINATNAYYGGDVIITGDDFGLVKLFQFPSLKKGAKFRKYVGHSAHVTNCRFSADNQRVITTGGGDHAIFQWRFLPHGIGADDDIADQNAYNDSNSEDSDSDMSDIGELDSDLEAETQSQYDRPVYSEDMNILKKNIKNELRAGEKRVKAPNQGLKLEFVHGYRGYDCRNNIFYLQNGKITYHVAAVGIVYDKEKHSQVFYLSHTDDILCLSIHPIKDIIATGQVGRDPEIHVWEAETLKTLSIMKGGHQRGVCAVDFSADGKRLASVGLDDNHTIVVWDWRKGEKLASTRGHKDKIFVIKWNPHETNKLVTVGMKHIKFWTQTGGGFTSSRGTFGDVAKLDTMLCVAYGRTPDVVYTGGSNGSIYLWTGNTLSKSIKAHEGPCFAMHALDKGFVTGGKDGNVSLWDEAFSRCLKSYPIKRSSLTPGTRGLLTQDSPSVRAIVLGHGHILVGTRNGEILEVTKDGSMNILTQGHKEGELWGLSVHPSAPQCATVSDDKTLRIWDTTSQHKMLNCKIMKKSSRCVDYSPDGKVVAVGHKDGSFSAFNTDTLEEILSFNHRKSNISDIKFSPDPGKYLAVGSHDNFIDIYNVASQKRVGVCKGNSSYITHIDWDNKGKLLMTNSGAKEQLFFEAPRGKRQTLRNTEIEKVDWSSWTAVLGHTCEGIWPPKCDVTDINASSLSRDKQLLATADDFGLVKLFEYPATGRFSKFKKYMGHSAHVTNVRWSFNGEQLISTGGADTSVMIWTRTGASSLVGQGDSDDSDTDSEGEGGYDSDVAREEAIDYTKKTYAKSMRKTAGIRPGQKSEEDDDDEDARPSVSRKSKILSRIRRADLPNARERKRKPISRVNELELDCVYGFRGFDCRNNLHYINDGADIVYHSAGAGIVLNLSSANQTFYLEHTDDIICLAVNEHPKFKNVIATGQIGSNPEVNIWDASTKQTLSVIQGFHKKGVCAVDFSCSGKSLLTVGLDDDHSVAVWRWQEGSKIASSEGHTSRIFHAEFRPDSDSHFVTVGVKHVKFWSILGGQLQGKKGLLANVSDSGEDIKMQTMLSVAFGANNLTFTGAMSGDVYVWHDHRLQRIVPKAHNGPIFTMFTTLRDGLIVTGAKEPVGMEGGHIKLWDQEMKRCRSFNIDSRRKMEVVKSVSRHKGKILVGTKENEFFEINEKTNQCQLVACGHSEGELWGLATHPSADRFATASDDGSVRMWDIANKRMLHKLQVGAARSVAFSDDGEMIAVGLKNGGFLILNATNFKIWGQRRDRGQMINDIRFSPDGQFLAVGSDEGCVDFYDLTKGSSLQRTGFCKGIGSCVLQMDFSADGKYLRVGTGNYEHQMFQVPSGGEVKDKSLINKIELASWTSVIGNEVIGVWPKDAGKADVNSAHVSRAGNMVVTGDDYGLVKLYSFPSTSNTAAHKTYAGHSAHVTNVRFTYDDRYLISAGGDDCCVFVWKSK